MHRDIAGVCLVAFAGDEERLQASIAGELSDVPLEVLVLAPSDASLARLADEASCTFLPALSSACDPARYWCEVAEALRDRRGAWLVLRAGTRLPDLWWRRWVSCHASCFALFPLSLRHPCTAVLADVAADPGLDLRDMDRWLNAYLKGASWDIPVFAGQTACIRPALLPSGRCTDDWQLAVSLRHSGAVLQATDNILVDDRQLPPQRLPKELQPAWAQAVHQRHPLAAARHALGQLVARREAPPPEVPPVRPAVLHISHSWGGGLGRWIDDFTAADDQALSYILRPIGDWSGFGQTLALYAANNPGFPLRTWTLAQPILSSAIAHGEYTVLLREVLESFHVDVVIVSSLIGHSLDVLRTRLPTLVVVHDFYPFCPPILASWGGPCSRCDRQRLSACLQQNPGHRFFLHEDEGHWQSLRQAFIEHVTRPSLQLVVPSASVAARMRSLVPALEHHDIPVIPHGLPPDLLSGLVPVAPGPAGERKLRIVVLGSLDVHKGAALLSASVSRLTHLAEIHLLGCGEGGRALENQPGVHVTETYQRESLGHLLAELAPDLGLLLSVVPETFSYTLSELQAAAVPVIATRLGAFVDRVEEGANGWLIEPEPAQLEARVEQLAAEPSRIDRARENLRRQARRTAADMVADYRSQLPEANTPVFRPTAFRADAMDGSDLLRVNPEASFGQALRAFWAYTVAKVECSERLPGRVKQVFRFLAKTAGR